MQVTDKPARIKLPAIGKFMAVQSVIAIFLAIILWQWDKEAGLAVFFGSAIFLIPNAYFAWQALRYSGAAKARQVARSIYKGQTAKFLLTAIMFAMLFKVVKPALIWVVFVSYALNAVIHVVATSMALKKANEFK